MSFFVNATSLVKPSSAAGALGRLVLGSTSGPAWHVATARVDHAQDIIRDVGSPHTRLKAVALSSNVDELAESMRRCGCSGLLLLPDAVDAPHWETTSKMLQAAKVAKLEHLVLVSTAASAPDSIVPSGKAWFQLESDAENTGIPLTVLHPSASMHTFLFGHMHEMICGRTLSVTMDSAKIAFVDGRDVAQVVSKVAAEPCVASTALHLTGAAALTWREVADTFSKHLCSPVRYSKFPLWAVQTSMWVQGKRPEEIQEVINMSKYYDAQYESQPSETLRQVLGREPRSFDQFVKDHVDEWPLQKFT